MTSSICNQRMRIYFHFININIRNKFKKKDVFPVKVVVNIRGVCAPPAVTRFPVKSYDDRSVDFQLNRHDIGFVHLYDVVHQNYVFFQIAFQRTRFCAIQAFVHRRFTALVLQVTAQAAFSLIAFVAFVVRTWIV